MIHSVYVGVRLRLGEPATMRDPADRLLPFVEKLYDAAGGSNMGAAFRAQVGSEQELTLKGLGIDPKTAALASHAATDANRKAGEHPLLSRAPGQLGRSIRSND